MPKNEYRVTIALEPLTLEVWAEDEEDAKWRAAHMMGGAGLSAAGTFSVAAPKRDAIPSNIGTAV